MNNILYCLMLHIKNISAVFQFFKISLPIFQDLFSNFSRWTTRYKAGSVPMGSHGKYIGKYDVILWW